MTDAPSGMQLPDEEQDTRLTALQDQVTALAARLALAEQRIGELEMEAERLAHLINRLTAGLPSKARTIKQ